MFGSRNDYKEFFQLWIPETLLQNWSKCFAFHRLAIDSIRNNEGAPVWLADFASVPTASSSIDRSVVDLESGEMSFGLFRYEQEKHNAIMARNNRADLDVLTELRSAFNSSEFPNSLFNLLEQDVKLRESSISFHKPSLFGTDKSDYSEDVIKNIRRKKGVFANNEFARSEKPKARHHLKIFYNKYGVARLFYKINGKSIKFMQRRR